MSTQQKTQKQLGTEQFKNKNYHKALQHYHKYIETEHEDNLQAMLNIAFCHHKLQEYQKTLQVCDQILEIDQKYSKCYYRKIAARKEILEKEKDNMVERYKLMYDCLMFKKYCDQKECWKEVEEFGLLAKNCKEIITPCEPVKMSNFERSLIELQKENISLYSLTELEQKHPRLPYNQTQQKRHKIDSLYKQMIKVKRQVKDSEEAKVLLEHIQRKISQLKEESHSVKKVEKDDKDSTVASTIGQDQVSITVLESNQIVEKPLTTPIVTEEIKINQIKDQKSIKQVTQPVQTVTLKVQAQKEKKQEKKQTEKATKAQQKSILPVKSEKQSVKLNLNMSAQQLFSSQLKQKLTSSRDSPKQFGQILTAILTNSDIKLQTKEELLKVVPKGLVDFKIMMMAMPRASKTELRQTILGLGVSQEIRKIYFPK